MVVALGPGKFYGSSLPRPRFYTDVKFNSDRVDPPLPVLDPLMSWAEEAHWAMGGLSFQRHRLQGRIEGNVEKLRNQIEKSVKKRETLSPKLPKKKFVSKSIQDSGKRKMKKDGDLNGSESPSPPPAPIANKRKRRYVGLVDEEEEGEPAARKWPVRKLSDEFDLVARSSGVGALEVESVASRTRGRKTVVHEPLKSGSKRLRKLGEDKDKDNGNGKGNGNGRCNGNGGVSPSPRSSPRLVIGR